MAQAAAQATLKRTGSLPQGQPFHIVFRRKLWINQRIPAADQVVNIIYHQVLEDIMANKLVTSREQEPDMLPLMTRLAAYQIIARPESDRSQWSKYVVAPQGCKNVCGRAGERTH